MSPLMILAIVGVVALLPAISAVRIPLDVLEAVQHRSDATGAVDGQRSGAV